jgi:hypothetical protein
MNIKKKRFELEIDLSEDISAAYLKDCECDRCADSSCECDCHNEAVGQKRFGGKPRTTLKDSDFLDPERRSFPVMSCQDVKDAVSSWGRYKGDMTFEQFKDRLTRKAKSIGCEKALPEKWKEESDAALTEEQKKLPPALQKVILKKMGKKPKEDEKKKDDKEDKESKGEHTADHKMTKEEWDKVNKEELKRDSKKEKSEHEKDAVKDDEDKIKKLKKGKPSEKKSVMIHDLKKDEKYDKKNENK